MNKNTKKNKILFFLHPTTVANNKKALHLKKYAVIDTSTIINNLNLDVRNPLENKQYLSIGSDCMINANIIFESQKGEVIIGNRVFLGGCTIISRSKVEV